MSLLDFFALLGMVCTPLSIVFGVALYTTKRELTLRKELARDVRERPMLADAGSGQLERAVDAIALEVERIAEGQRFVTKLLAERATEKAPALPAPPRIVTPH